MIDKDKCQDDIFIHGESLGLYNMSKEDANRFCSEIRAKVTGYKYDWHYIAGRVHMLVMKESIVTPCDHEWVDARNQVVKSGEFCLKCNSIRSGNQISEDNND